MRMQELAIQGYAQQLLAAHGAKAIAEAAQKGRELRNAGHERRCRNVAAYRRGSQADERTAPKLRQRLLGPQEWSAGRVSPRWSEARAGPSTHATRWPI